MLLNETTTEEEMVKIENRIEYSNQYHQKTITGKIVLTHETDFWSTYDGRGCVSEKLTLAAGTNVDYEYKETRSGNYHIARARKSGRIYETVKVQPSEEVNWPPELDEFVIANNDLSSPEAREFAKRRIQASR